MTHSHDRVGDRNYLLTVTRKIQSPYVPVVNYVNSNSMQISYTVGIDVNCNSGEISYTVIRC